MSSAGDKRINVKSDRATKSRLAEHFGRNQAKGGIADWMECDPELLIRAVAGAAWKGAALRFGYTSDGGAYAIGVYDGDDRTTLYCRPGEDINATLQQIIEYFRES